MTFNANITDPILQQELSEYRLGEELCQLHKQRRESIIARLEQGADTEPGPLSVSLKVEYKRTLSFPKLEAAVGREQADCIRDGIEPTPYRCLTIHDQPVQLFGQHGPNNRSTTPRRLPLHTEKGLH